MKKTVEEFLKKHTLSADCVDMEKLCNYMLEEMDKGLEGKASSLEMIDSFCKPTSKIETGKKVIVIDAGGTNFRTGLVSFDDTSSVIIEDFKKSKMPGIEREVTSEEFFSEIADQVERLIDKSDRIGFCFSYSAKILEDHDAVVLSFSKEIKAPQVVGKHLGKELFAELERRGHNMSGKKISIMNDTVTTLLAGLSETSSRDCEGCVGLILGTGTNTSYMTDSTIYNEESGGLRLSLGDIDEAFLKSTDNPQIHQFEKMISGAYLGPCADLVLRYAADEGVIDSKYVSKSTLTSTEMSLLIESQDTDEDVKDILVEFVRRCSKLTAANLAASIIKSGFGRRKPVLINADGSTFYKTPHLKEFTEEFLFDFLKKKNLSAVITQIDNSPVTGSAIGVLSL